MQDFWLALAMMAAGGLPLLALGLVALIALFSFGWVPPAFATAGIFKAYCWADNREHDKKNLCRRTEVQQVWSFFGLPAAILALPALMILLCVGMFGYGTYSMLVLATGQVVQFASAMTWSRILVIIYIPLVAAISTAVALGIVWASIKVWRWRHNMNLPEVKLSVEDRVAVSNAMNVGFRA